MYAKTLAGIVIDILANSQPRVPYDTGKLRASGTAALYSGKTGHGRKMIVGVGKREDQTVNAQLHALRMNEIKRAKFVRGEVSYYRMSDDDPNFDVAVFTHEILYPFEMRGDPNARPAATKPNTGPKYLELAFKENKSVYENAIRSVIRGRWFERNIQVLSKLRKKPKGMFMVDLVDIVHDRIAFLGGYVQTLKRYVGGRYV